MIQRDHADGKKLACSYNTTYLLESTITIYDRRTRAVVDERRLEGKNRCPQATTYTTQGSSVMAQKAFAIGPKELKQYVDERLAAAR